MALDQSLVDHLAFHHRFQIGIAAAEALKLQLSEVLSGKDQCRTVEVKGRDTTTGLPRSLCLAAEDLLPVWLRHVEQIVGLVRNALAETPPELSQDVLEDGIVLTGGGAVAALLAEEVASQTGVATRVADAPRNCVALGLLRLLEQRERATPTA